MCFIWMWEFYLVYCEGGFLECLIGVLYLLMVCFGYWFVLIVGEG